MVTVGYMFSKATPLSNITWTKEFRYENHLKRD